uniref:NADH-ubiquinone oxidoreductase chain 3 n=1 Tax=Osmia excavata TaxID=124290 RepID=A0A2R2Z386_9HYME|nr:NADH dehydrogenase subunit 3 [Osmia excavata]
MFNIMFLFNMSFIIIILLTLINFFLSMYKPLNREKITPFECGFNAQSNSRLPFSTQFFLITLLFLIFDIEIILILPSIFLMKFKSIFLMFIMLIFIFLMIISLIIEWSYSLLNWIF